MFQATEEQLKDWQAKHGPIHKAVLGTEEAGDQLCCYLKRPSRKQLSYAATVYETNPMRFNEILVDDMWVAGDEQIKTDDAYFFPLCDVLAQIIEKKKVELVKL